MQWRVHGERRVYESPWVSLALVDVELPDGSRVDHHVVRMPAPAAGTVVTDPDRGVLAIWRHRFITDTWGWEIPAGRVEPGEDPAQAAAREVLEETGWQPGALRHLTSTHPSNGLSDQTFHLYVADGATHVGPPSDVNEADEVRWLAVDEVTGHLAAGRIRDGLSVSALCWWLALGSRSEQGARTGNSSRTGRMGTDGSCWD